MFLWINIFKTMLMQFLEYTKKLLSLSFLNTAVCLEPVKNQCDFYKS